MRVRRDTTINGLSTAASICGAAIAVYFGHPSLAFFWSLAGSIFAVNTAFAHWERR